jgi:hypothetical protein
MDALNMTIDSKNEHITQLKDSVVEAEMKSRKALDRLTKIQAGEAQENIDKSIDFLSKKMHMDPTRRDNMNNQGVLTNSNNRLNSYKPD